MIVVFAVSARLARRVVGRDDQRLVTGSAQVLQDAQDRVADTVDIGEEGFGDDSNAHAIRMAALPVVKVADGDTGREICCSKP